MSSSVPLSKANTSFSLALSKKLSDSDKAANIVHSPFSISSALAMVMLGARGNTATQMSEVLCFTETQQPQQVDVQQQMDKCLKNQDCQDDVHSDFAQLLSELNKPDAPYALSIANRLYGEQSFQFVEDFLAKTRQHYSSELESVDFKSSSEEARVYINSWVEKQTQGKIKDLLSKKKVDNTTRLVLVNAVYFKGSWDKQFKEDSTVDAQFRINKNDTKPVKMMRQTSEFPYTTIPEVNCKILEMAYQGKDLSMLIFLPNEIEDDTTGLEKLEKELTYEKLVEWTRPDLMRQGKVAVRLPPFKLEEAYDLKDVLKSMGMVDAFDDSKSDFSGMSPANDLVLSDVIHKAFIEVNEEGTEAAAATGGVVGERSAIICPTFIADHPFLFFIRHNATMSILFAGRFCVPN